MSKILNNQQGAQFTCEEWLAPRKAANVSISMDGKGRWIDNVFIERLWASVKYEDVYLREYSNGHEAQRSLTVLRVLHRTALARDARIFDAR